MIPRKFSVRAALDVGVAGNLLVSERYPPFAIHELDPHGRIIRQFLPDTSLLSGLGGMKLEKEHLVALGTLPLQPGYVQALGDPSGIERVLVTYGTNGASMHAALLQQPMGLVASYPAQQLLLVYRRLDVQELVAYRWRWVPDHGSHPRTRREP
jgi:hypothetical protein